MNATDDHNRRRLARLADQPDDGTAAGRFQRQMLAAIDQFERERAAERARNGDPNPYDLDPLEYVRTIADNYARHRDLPDADAMCLELAAELGLDDIRALRLAGEAAVAATPHAIRAARADGMKPPAIAAELGLTPSRIYQVLREQPPADGDQ